MELTIRKTDPKRVERWRASEWEKFGKARGYEWDSREFCLAARSGPLAGIAKFSITGGVAHLRELLVGEKFRNRKIGSALLAWFEKFCAGRGCHKLTLRTSRETVRFYGRHGYAISCVLRDDRFHQDWWLMEKRLSPGPAKDQTF